MKIGFLITARLKSSRLPLKLLLDLNGKSVFERVIDRCKKVSNIDKIILCTSTKSQDNELVEIAKNNNIYYFMGDEMDVLKRLRDAANFYDLDYIINITGENPLFSIYHANLVVNQALIERNDFIYLSGLPIGCGVYGLRPEALRVVCDVKNEIDTEIWGPLINRPNVFNVKEIQVQDFYCKSNLRITTDYFEDYQFIKSIYDHFDSRETPDLFDVLGLLIENPALEKIHSKHLQAGLSPEILKNIEIYYENNKSKILELKKKYYN